jgi:hypothetical protein
VKLGAVLLALTLCAVLIGFLSGIALVAAVAAFLLILGFEQLVARGLVRRSLLQALRNPLAPPNARAMTSKVVPVGMIVAGLALVIAASVSILDRWNYFAAALGGASIAHALFARNAFSALAKEGALS